MRIVLSAFVAAFAAGCVTTPDNSNNPDSGVDCSQLPPDAGGLNPGVPNGSGTLLGPLSFDISAAYETRETTMSLPWKFPDGGTGPVTTGSYLSVLMYGGPVVCGGDAGTNTLPVIWLGLTDSAGNYPAGDYPVQADGGTLGAFAFIESPNDGGYLGSHARSGTVHLTAAATCSLSGGFDLQLLFDDGGTTTASGSFDAPYCR